MHALPPLVRPPAFRRNAWTMAILAAASLAACGGGGGGDTGGATETPQGTGSGTVPIDAVGARADAFYLKVDETLNSADALAAATGGNTFASWNPKGTKEYFAPGMRVSFFGDPTGCASGTKLGAVSGADASDLSQMASRTGLQVSAPELTWLPSGNSPGCTGVADRKGPSGVYVDPRAGGGLALYTSAGPRDDGRGEFFGVFGAAGQDGAGTNANLTGTYLAFRQAWRTDKAIKPFLNGNQAGTARILVSQALNGAALGSSDSTLTQGQQIFSLHLINKTCLAWRSSTALPCQMNYLFTAAIQRNNLSDWSQVGWAQKVRVWYDAAQGGIPIVEGLIKSRDVASIETDTGWDMFSSKGHGTQHGPYAYRSFDVRISMPQLTSLLRILTGRQLGIAPATVTEEQLQAMWSADWQDPKAWVVESLNVGQEMSSADRSKPVWMGGHVRELYVGPAGA
ncbi:MAG: hypothetical protein J0M20_15800 [Burkholderiales bacterium]|nr:hypothetical protein [Burkholderiales bacterium]